MIESGQIQREILYKVIGTKSVEYNSIEYATGQTFRGVADVTDFIYVGSGTEKVSEVSEFLGASLELKQSPAESVVVDRPTVLFGMSIEMQMTEEDKVVLDTTEILGMSVELRDFPYYALEISCYD